MSKTYHKFIDENDARNYIANRSQYQDAYHALMKLRHVAGLTKDGRNSLNKSCLIKHCEEISILIADNFAVEKALGKKPDNEYVTQRIGDILGYVKAGHADNVLPGEADVVIARFEKHTEVLKKEAILAGFHSKVREPSKIQEMRNDQEVNVYWQVEGLNKEKSLMEAMQMLKDTANLKGKEYIAECILPVRMCIVNMHAVETALGRSHNWYNYVSKINAICKPVWSAAPWSDEQLEDNIRIVCRKWADERFKLKEDALKLGSEPVPYLPRADTLQEYYQAHKKGKGRK